MPNQPKTPLRSVRVPDELWTSAKRQAATDNRTVTDIVIAALETYTQAPPTKEPSMSDPISLSTAPSVPSRD